jgi:hypothetical protein
MDVKQLKNKYVHEYVLIILNNDRKIKGYIEDYNVPLDLFMIHDFENHEYLFISRKLIKDMEVIDYD